MSVTTEQVWNAIEEATFGVLAFSNRDGNPRTAGVVYVVDERSLLISSVRDTWKVRHITANPSISMTVTIPKRIPFIPMIKVPAATITFQGHADVLALEDAAPEPVARLARGLEFDGKATTDHVIIRVVPEGEFVTYGIGVSTITMRKPALATARVACGTQLEPSPSG